MKILINHVGYELEGIKRAVVEAPAAPAIGGFKVLRKGTDDVALTGPVKALGGVDKWRDWHFWGFDFSALTEPGEYEVAVEVEGVWHRSAPFPVRASLLPEVTLGDVMKYFESQRSRGRFDEADRAVPFVGDREGTVDAHGGWYDAAGDTSKYFSHLSYANFFNPQQTPMAVLALLDGARALRAAGGRDELATAMLEEAVYGADWIVRMQDPAGYFYMNVFDQWSKELEKRMICSYKTQQGHRLESYQCGYRQGAGVAIGALARVAAEGLSRDYETARYLQVAESAFDHLETHNVEYLDDGKENIIDDYCALVAATELWAATKNERYLAAARHRSEGLLERLSKDEKFDGWFRADDGDRPFWHAAEAGLPIVALLRWRELESDASRRAAIEAGALRHLRHELAITAEVPNAFGYARQYVRPLGGEARSSFFVPHENETGYWWQGESARIASISTACYRYLRQVGADATLTAQLTAHAQAQLDWILGLNPFDACLLFGHGRGNVNYEEEWPNRLGGISNGITSGYEDERCIDYVREGLQGDQMWRWTEQWIPHASWYLVAVAEQEALLKGR